MSFVLVPHFGRDVKTALPEILSKTSGLNAHLAENGMRLEPSHVYLQPPNFDLTVEKGIFRVRR
jgi:two-component system CheB/CheR fusion protein